MTLTLQDEDAVADFLEYLADLIRQRKISGINIVMSEDGIGRAAIEFKPGQKVPEVLTQDETGFEELDTDPAFPAPPKKP